MGMDSNAILIAKGPFANTNFFSGVFPPAFHAPHFIYRQSAAEAAVYATSLVYEEIEIIFDRSF